MKFSLKCMVLAAALTLVLAGLTGCAETNTPGTKLTASVAASDTTANHTHTVSIPFSDLGGGKTVDYRSSVTSGHSHVIALSGGQLSDLNNGLRVVVTSTPAVTDGHTHTWNILGGNIVYESICYNCHSNDKRGVSQPPLQSQKNALQSPSTQPLSSALTVTPDPNYGTTAQTLTISTSSLAAATVGSTYSQTLSATGGTSPYLWSISSGALPAGLSLTNGVISGTPTVAGNFPITVKAVDSATAAQSVSKDLTVSVTAVAIPIDGAAFYTTTCAGCHGPLASSTKRGRSAAQITAAIGSVGSMSGLSSLTTAQIQAIATALQ
jgi:mono/diheme cytochrome c family protein